MLRFFGNMFCFVGIVLSSILVVLALLSIFCLAVCILVVGIVPVAFIAIGALGDV